MLRHQPPVHSPLSAGALAAGVAAALGGARRARAEVERTLAERFGSDAVLLTASGTAALTLALRAAAREHALPVALPAYCCYDVATGAEGAEVPVLLYDLEPTSLSPDPETLRAALERGARSVVVAHLYGIPVDLGAVRTFVSRYGALLIEDAAQGAGASYADRPLGAHGALGILSFGRGKGITGGRGGALLGSGVWGAAAVSTAGEALSAGRTAPAEPVAALAQWVLARPGLYALPASLPFLGLGETTYRPPVPARALSPFAAGMLRRTLALAEREAAARRRHAKRLLELIGTGRSALGIIQPPPQAAPGYLRLPVLVPEPLQARFRSPRARALGIMPGYPETLADLPGFGQRVGNLTAAFPGADRLAGSLFTLPTHSRLGAADFERLERWLGALE
jgi:perosamine synthetase